MREKIPFGLLVTNSQKHKMLIVKVGHAYQKILHLFKNIPLFCCTWKHLWNFICEGTKYAFKVCKKLSTIKHCNTDFVQYCFCSTWFIISIRKFGLHMPNPLFKMYITEKHILRLGHICFSYHVIQVFFLAVSSIILPKCPHQNHTN